MKTLFWNEDTQKDFMNKNGALYVPGAEEIKPNLKALTGYAQSHGINIFGSVDAHSEKDPEMAANGGPFPYHCIAGTEGQKHVPETMPKNPLFVKNYHHSTEKLEKILVHKGGIFFEKQAYDASTNPMFEPVLKSLGVTEAVVYGVATDYCVKGAVLALRKLGIDVYLVTDAIAAVNEKTGKAALEEMLAAGVKPVTTAQILRGEK